MDKKELKRLWTDVAKGKISEKDALLLIKPKKSDSGKPKQQIKGKSSNARKRPIKAGGKIK